MDSTWAENWAVTAAELDLPERTSLISCVLPSASRLGLALGVADFLSKPVDREELLKAFARLPRSPETVLIVDNDPNVVRLFERMLRADYPALRVLAAYDGKAGLEAAQTQHPDVILLELALPEMSGFDFLKLVTADKTMAGTQIIIVSAQDVELATTPLQGHWHLAREAGFSITETLGLLQALLAAVTKLPAAAPASAAASARDRPG
jgi:CheY-like chemotaxis protein